MHESFCFQRRNVLETCLKSMERKSCTIAFQVCFPMKVMTSGMRKSKRIECCWQMWTYRHIRGAAWRWWNEHTVWSQDCNSANSVHILTKLVLCDAGRCQWVKLQFCTHEIRKRQIPDLGGTWSCSEDQVR